MTETHLISITRNQTVRIVDLKHTNVFYLKKLEDDEMRSITAQNGIGINATIVIIVVKDLVSQKPIAFELHHPCAFCTSHTTTGHPLTPKTTPPTEPIVKL